MPRIISRASFVCHHYIAAMREWVKGEFGAFPATHWSLVARAADAATGREALDALLRQYLPALRARLVVERGIHPDKTEDLLQGFIADKILERELLARADQTLGRFRSFILTSLDRYLVDQSRSALTQRNNPCQGPMLALSEVGDFAPTGGRRRFQDGFDQAWGKQVIAEAIDRMRKECEGLGRSDLWGVFQARVLGPTIDGAPAMPYDDLVRQFGFSSPEQASNVLVTAKRMFARMFRAVVAECAQDGPDAEAELTELRVALAGGSAGGRMIPRI